MARKIKLKNGKSFTYLTPDEKVEKYRNELKYGYKFAYGKIAGLNELVLKPRCRANLELDFLTDAQKKYREDYIRCYKNATSKGSNDCCRDIANFNNYYKK